MQLRQMSNDQLFELYDSDLVLRIHNQQNLRGARRLLAQFQAYLGQWPPSKELAKGFLALYTDRKPLTLYTYSVTLGTFMRWYGEEMDDLKLKRPKTMPPYVEADDIDRLYEALGEKRTHKGIIERDQLLVHLARRSGLRRAELANLEVRHCHDGWIEVRGGKGGKDRRVPLANGVNQQLQAFISGREPEEKVFKLKAASISDKIRQFAKKAGVPIRCHSLRHHCATALLERGGNPEAVRQLLGHENLATTQQYVALARGAMREVVELLEDDVPGGYTGGDQHRGDDRGQPGCIGAEHNALGDRHLMSWEIVEQRRRNEELLQEQIRRGEEKARRMSY